MARGFQRLHFHMAEEPEAEAAPRYRGIGALAGGPPEAQAFNSDEAAARFHLNKVLEGDERPAMRGVAAPHRAEAVPSLQLVDTQDVPQTGTRLVRFDQTHDSIPVFGARAVVELDQRRDLVSVDGQIARVEGVSPVASISPQEALTAVAKLVGRDPGQLPGVQPPQLNFFPDQGTGAWHLVYVFSRVPAAPPGAAEAGSRGHGLGPSPRADNPLFDYLVDAHTGDVVFSFSAQPLLMVPTQCFGKDEEGASVSFFGSLAGQEFEMRDPFRSITTFDNSLTDVPPYPPPALSTPVRNPASDWGEANRAAVSAHVNATKVHRFYKSILERDGIDNKGMELISVVNCTYSQSQQPPEWFNAQWFAQRMWYGQIREPNGTLRSFSRYLDVIAHELTHGVTETTAQLVYKDESGALDESFSDIFGVMIKNWDFETMQPRPIAQWDWEIGAGLGGNGLPLRDLRDPTRTGDPDHMRSWVRTTVDEGGVHTNSNIHNKAAYNVLTLTDDAGQPAFSPTEVAYLYYLTLTRLTRLATFSETLEGMIAVAATFYAGDPAVRDAKVESLKKAYAGVGIS